MDPLFDMTGDSMEDIVNRQARRRHRQFLETNLDLQMEHALSQLESWIETPDRLKHTSLVDLGRTRQAMTSNVETLANDGQFSNAMRHQRLLDKVVAELDRRARG